MRRGEREGNEEGERGNWTVALTGWGEGRRGVRWEREGDPAI